MEVQPRYYERTRASERRSQKQARCEPGLPLLQPDARVGTTGATLLCGGAACSLPSYLEYNVG